MLPLSAEEEVLTGVKNMRLENYNGLQQLKIHSLIACCNFLLRTRLIISLYMTKQLV